jgi:hypothetical protein
MAVTRGCGGKGIMEGTGMWISGGLVALFGIIGLFVSARAGAEEAVAYYGGLAFFVFAVLFILLLMKKSFDHAEASRH